MPCSAGKRLPTIYKHSQPARNGHERVVPRSRLGNRHAGFGYDQHGDLPWREVFTDPQLQSLIQLGLEQNTDLQTAILKVQEAEAGLMSARLAYTPSLNLAPQGGLSWYENHRRTWTWSAPIAASWEIDIFGKLLNAKRGAKAAVLQSQAYKQAVQTQVIAAVANYYYTLLMLDEQLAITENTSVLWKKTVETMRAMKEAGMVNEAAIVQSEANSYMIEASIPELKQQIREIENALSLILKEAPQQIERGSLKSQSFPAMMNAGVPVQLLSNRPDVKAAEMAFAGTFYNTNALPGRLSTRRCRSRETSDGRTNWVAWWRTRAK